MSDPVIGPDGTVYLLAGSQDAQGQPRQSLVALDAAGYARPGWPIEEPPGSDFGSVTVAPDGSVYVEECGGAEVGCVLHRLDATGRDLPGWPFEVPPDLVCCSDLAIGAEGTVLLWREGGRLQLVAVNAAGEIVPGWPVARDDQGMWWSNAQVGTDGTVFILRSPDRSVSPASLWAFAPDGSLRPGWPVSVPDVGGYLLGPQGTVVVWSLIDDTGEFCPEPRRTVFTMLGADGRTLPGWPRGSTGSASSPIVGADGTVYYISALGNVYAHDRTGEIKSGWPVSVPGSISWCSPRGPYLAPDGTVYVLADEYGRGSEVAALAPDGHSRAGWPYRLAGHLSLPCLDYDCVPYPEPPAFGPDGTVYVVVYQADVGSRLEVVALDQRGQLKAGWPSVLPIDPASVEVGSLTVSPDGRLFVRA